MVESKEKEPQPDRKTKKIIRDADRLDDAAKLLSEVARILVDTAVEQSEDNGKLSKSGKRLREKARELLKDIADIHEEATELRRKIGKVDSQKDTEDIKSTPDDDGIVETKERDA